MADSDHWLVIDGRRWRRSDPVLSDEVVEALKSHLGRARSAVGVSKRAGDDEAVAAARLRVNLAKTGLGERGPKWWESDEADRLARARDALERLDG